MKTRFRSERGASLVEFALILPLLLVILFGIIEFGLIMYNKAIITNASREGARRGIVFRTLPPDFAYSPLSDAEITGVVNQYLADYLIGFAGDIATTTISRAPGTPSGNLLTVQVSYPYQFLVLRALTSLLPGGSALPGTVNLSSAATMRME